MTTPPFFTEFPKLSRFSRECIITEKIDGTNAQILITEEGELFTGSRTRWITPQDDNFGFAAWAQAHKEELLTLGVGRHFGEWWGSGIQRGYGLMKGEKRFSLFNTARWCLYGHTPKTSPTANPQIQMTQDILPECVSLVPVLWTGNFDFIIQNLALCLDDLATCGSHAAPGFMKPEGVVIFHTASNTGFKKTLEKDETPKSLQ